MGTDPQIERSILLHNSVSSEIRGNRWHLVPNFSENFFEKYTVLNLS